MALSHGMDTNHKTHVASQRETNETQCSKSWPVQTKETAYSGIVVTYPVQFTGTDLQQDRECGDWPDFLNSAYSYPKWRWADTFRSSVPTVVQDVGFLKQAMRLYGDSQCADDIRPWTLLDKGKDGLHPIPLKKNNTPGSHFFFTNPIHHGHHGIRGVDTILDHPGGHFILGDVLAMIRSRRHSEDSCMWWRNI